jgi:fused signal recognition particle receptor
MNDSPPPPSAEKRGLFARLFGKKDSSPVAEPISDEADLRPPREECSFEEPLPAEEASVPEPSAPQEEPPVPEIAIEEEETAEAEEPVPETIEETPKLSLWQRLKKGLSRTSSALTEGLKGLTKKKIDAETLDDLEDLLIQADFGLTMANTITNRLRAQRVERGITPQEIQECLVKEITRVLTPVAQSFVIGSDRPFVVMLVGVNGAGKTTTLGKLAQQFARQGHSVCVAAGDTFRAAAVEQLAIWGQRAGVPVIRSEKENADAAGVAFDALTQAEASKTDVVLIDTAGRLHNKTGLMAELEKMIRVIRKKDATAPHAVLLVLDATVGQNALRQVELFQKAAGVTGLIMTKLDGTARGGILVALAEQFQLPIHWIGIGEGIEDLTPFDAEGFARALVTGEALEGG